MSRAETLANFATQDALTVDNTNDKVGIASTTPDATLDIKNTILMDGDAGIITAVSFAGDGSGLTGVANTDVLHTREVTVSGVSTFTGTIDANGALDVDGQTDLDVVNISDTLTLTQGLMGVGATFTGQVSVGGTITYEDVTQVDSVGIVTARKGVRISAGGLSVAGVTTLSGNTEVAIGKSINFAKGSRAFLQENAVGLGSTTTTGRNAGINTAYGTLIYNATTDAINVYNTQNKWGAVAVSVATLSSISGNLIPGVNSTLTFTGTGFGVADGCTIKASGGSISGTVSTDATSTNDTTIAFVVPGTIYNNIASGESISFTVTNSAGSESSSVAHTVVTLPTGGNAIGTYTDSNNYRSHTFTATGSFVVHPTYTVTADYLIVGGGGGGGNANGGGAGGGAGGMRTNATPVSLPAATYPVTVGTGGAGTPAPSGNTGSNGVASVFNSVPSAGGGGGGGDNNAAGNGGSGGGGGRANGAIGTGTAGQGNDGGDGNSNEGGGGGGKGSAGSPAPPTAAGPGGNGSPNTYKDGTSILYAGGGGGGAENNGPTSYGNGGPGGGGKGGAQTNSSTPHNAATPGTDGLGGGGGGSADFLNTVGVSKAGDGGDGVVIIRYPLA
tara:strand:+ start:3911 stop:5755 length:1845 start_codon:yes stop_codon:yes gene_type:complete